MPTTRTSTNMTSMEQRLMSYLESSISEINAKLDKLVQTSTTKTEHERLENEVGRMKTDVEVLKQKVQVVESVQNSESASKAQRPWRTWQIVLGVLSILFMVFFQFVGFVISVITLLR